MTIPNSSLVVSEPLLPHCPQYKAGVYYVEAPVDALVKSILYYLDHENDRQHIVENAHRLVTTKLALLTALKPLWMRYISSELIKLSMNDKLS